jgi:hypothetical protein
LPIVKPKAPSKTAPPAIVVVVVAAPRVVPLVLPQNIPFVPPAPVLLANIRGRVANGIFWGSTSGTTLGAATTTTTIAGGAVLLGALGLTIGKALLLREIMNVCKIIVIYFDLIYYIINKKCNLMSPSNDNSCIITIQPILRSSVAAEEE